MDVNCGLDGRSLSWMAVIPEDLQYAKTFSHLCSVKTLKYVKYVLNMFPILFLKEDYRIFSSKIL